MHALATLAVVLSATSVSAAPPRATVIESVTTRTRVTCRTLVRPTTHGGPVPTTTINVKRKAVQDIVYISTHHPITNITPSPTTSWDTTTTTVTETASQVTDTVSTTSTIISVSATSWTITTTTTLTLPAVTSSSTTTTTVPTPDGWYPARTPMPTPTRLRKRTRPKPKPKSTPASRPGTLIFEPARKAQVFPQAVTCTRVAWAIPVQTFVFQGTPHRRTLPTPTVTATAMVTASSTSTVYPTDASTTLYFTQTMTQYAAYSELITATATTIPTVTAVSTATAYAACATDYVLGPRTQDDQENLAYLIMNGAVASLDQVNVTTPLDCCNACWSSNACAGSAWVVRDAAVCYNVDTVRTNFTSQSVGIPVGVTNASIPVSMLLSNGPVGSFNVI